LKIDTATTTKSFAVPFGSRRLSLVTLIQAYHQYDVGSRPALQITKKGALDSQPQVTKFTSCLPMVGGSLRVLRLLPPLKLVAMI
jgi:hypothetical protein